MQKWHSGIHCLNARLSRAKPIGASQMIFVGVIVYRPTNCRRSHPVIGEICAAHHIPDPQDKVMLYRNVR